MADSNASGTDKLSFKLPVFEGPLDMLLHLIRKDKLNIYDIQISRLLEQYMEYIGKMSELDMDIASEFLEMAARLIYMKTVSLLPKQDEIEQLKTELTGQLLEYQVCQQMAALLAKQAGGFDHFVRKPAKIERDPSYLVRHQVAQLYDAFLAAAGKRGRKLPPPPTAFKGIVARQIVSVSSKIIFILRMLKTNSTVKFRSLFQKAKSKSELVATFLALLELIKAKRITVSDIDDQKVSIL